MTRTTAAGPLAPRRRRIRKRSRCIWTEVNPGTPQVLLPAWIALTTTRGMALVRSILRSHRRSLGRDSIHCQHGRFFLPRNDFATPRKSITTPGNNGDVPREHAIATTSICSNNALNRQEGEKLLRFPPPWRMVAHPKCAFRPVNC